MADSKIRTKLQRDRLAKRRQPYYVAGVRGGWSLGFRKWQTTRLWVVRVLLGPGRYKQETVGTADSGPDSIEYPAALQAASEAAQRIQANQGADGRLTVERAAREYLVDLSNRGGDVETARLHLERFNDVFGADLVADLDKERLTAWHDKLPAQKPRARTARMANKQNRHNVDMQDEETKRRRRASANRIMNTVRAMLNRAAMGDDKLNNERAWKYGLKPFPKTNSPREAWFSQADAGQFLNACAPDFRELAAAALLTGCRLGELQRLKKSNFKADKGFLEIKKTKSGGERTVYLNASAVDFFRRLGVGKRAVDLLLTRADGSPWTRSAHTRPMRAACEAAGLERIPFHCLRHTYASLAIEAGASLQIIAKNLGHASTRMTERHYTHIDNKHLSKQIKKTTPAFAVALPGDQVTAIDKAKRKRRKKSAA